MLHITGTHHLNLSRLGLILTFYVVPYKAVCRIPKFSEIAYEINTITKSFLFIMKYIIDGGCFFYY